MCSQYKELRLCQRYKNKVGRLVLRIETMLRKYCLSRSSLLTTWTHLSLQFKRKWSCIGAAQTVSIFTTFYVFYASFYKFRLFFLVLCILKAKRFVFLFLMKRRLLFCIWNSSKYGLQVMFHELWIAYRVGGNPYCYFYNQPTNQVHQDDTTFLVIIIASRIVRNEMVFRNENFILTIASQYRWQ